MVQNFINDCYIIGTALLYLKELNLERIEQIKNNLMSWGVTSELTTRSIKNTVLEWRDFFELTAENNIRLTEGASENKFLVEMIFYTVLSDEVKKCVLDSIFNKKNQKIIYFLK